ncbi:MAG: hypothetical protein CYG60_21975 [Actinobacteria bacterium]|nr:MAG: hypothetical protein CYG60_21975 [Actinomycetota bacterium]
MSKGGPATEGGKEVARWNATRHGMRSPAPVVPGIEAQEDWERHLAGTLESLAPEGHLETVLAERVALLSWRLHRVTCYETESIALYQEKAEDDLARERRFESRVLLLGPAHPKDVRADLEHAQAKHRLSKRLPKLPDGRKLSAFDADVILEAVTEHTDRVAEGDKDTWEILESTQIPGVPDGAEAREDYDGWTAGVVRAGIKAVAHATDEDPTELLEFATDSAKRAIIGKEQTAEQVARDLSAMSRERLLPDEKTLEKVARYEAHLSRLFHKALHELEAMQARRSGGAAPLAHLDVEGLPEGLGSEG